LHAVYDGWAAESVVTPISDNLCQTPDRFIAATALHRGMTLVTPEAGGAAPP